jgi:hypothetical protein
LSLGFFKSRGDKACVLDKKQAAYFPSAFPMLAIQKTSVDLKGVRTSHPPTKPLPHKTGHSAADTS